MMAKSESTFQKLSALEDLSAFGGFCGSLVLKSIKRSAINIQRSMLDVRVFGVQSVHCFGQAEFHTKGSKFLIQSTPSSLRLAPNGKHGARCVLNL
jgi:hypothetical protein